MRFRGRSQRSLDPKSRLMLPPNFREILLSRSEEGGLVLTTYDNCLVGFPLNDWLKFEEKMDAMPNANRLLRDFRRTVLGGAEEKLLDSQGRILLSKDHLAYAGITRDAVVVGQGSRFEIWDPARLEAVLSQNFDDITNNLEPGFDIFV